MSDPPPPPARPVDAAPRYPERVTSRELLGGRRRLIIEHEGETYSLTLTRRGKLILTK